MRSSDSSAGLQSRVAAHLRAIYPNISASDISALALRIIAAFDPPPAALGSGDRRGAFRDDEVVLISYGDTFMKPGQPHLRSLGDFWQAHFAQLFTTLHVLPFFPSSSDGGFSIVDYRHIDPALGDWDDLGNIGADELMVDLVCNHGSTQSDWFADFVADRTPGRDFYLTASPEDDLTAVTRPRTHPLLLPVETAAGTRHVWATFSHDQVDFDFANPDVLVEFCSVLGAYVAHGATRIRLDAIAYLWKQIGTSCVHLSQTHEIVKLMRTLLSAHDEQLLLITETNVPHHHNVSYFGTDGQEEAHVVYNFTLAPLIVWSLLVGQAETLTNWISALEPPPAGCAMLNFLATHDGLGLRPVEDLLRDEELAPLVERSLAVGGDVSTYSTPTGPQPYELNVSLVDMLAGGDGATADRFVLAHALMLAVQGIPAFYVHSMLASPGDVATVAATGHKRDINRARLPLHEAHDRIASGWRSSVFSELAHLITVRRSLTALGPQSPQTVHHFDPRVVAIERGSGRGAVLTLHNVTDTAVELMVPDRFAKRDLLTGTPVTNPITLGPWRAAWLGS